MPAWQPSYVTEVTGYTSEGDEIKEESVEIPEQAAHGYGEGKVGHIMSSPKSSERGYGDPLDLSGHDDTMTNEEDGGVNKSGSRYGPDAQSVGYTAYTMNMTSGEQIIEELRNVGVNVLSVEGDADVFAYLDAVTAERLPGEQCLLYVDDMGRVFNIVIAGGARGLSSAWEMLQATFSGWLVCVSFPLIARILAGASALPNSTNPDEDDENKPMIGVVPGLQLMVLGLFFLTETSQSWISTAINVRGINSVGAYVWNSSVFLTDYLRYFMLLCLSLAAFAPALDTPVRGSLTVAGAAVGLITMAANLGSRSWRKLNMGYLDGDSVITPLLAYMAAVLAGFTFPYVGMRAVHGGSDDSEVNLSLATFGNTGGARRARQIVTLTAAVVAIIFGATDVREVQEALGFHWQHRGTVNLAVGTWWLLSAIASLSVCHRMEPSRSIKIEPFLKRDESSPVGSVVPSIPNMVVEPANRGGEPIIGCCPLVFDILGGVIVAALGALLIWQGVQQINGTGGETAVDVVP